VVRLAFAGLDIACGAAGRLDLLLAVAARWRPGRPCAGSAGRLEIGRKAGKPLDVRGSFTIESYDLDGGLQSDAFTGYERDSVRRMREMIRDVDARRRILKRTLFSRSW
jgi:hypothetical protein